jgi:NADH-quinone oxidoreductase subunit F
MGISFADLLELAGGVRDGRILKAVIPGGSSVPVVKGEVMMEANMDFDSIIKAGSYLGSGAVIVMDDTTCMVKVLERIARFYHSESCGQCTPCREGTGWMHRVISRIENGQGQQEDLDKLVDVANKIEGRTICAFGDAAAWPVQSFIKQFRDEFQYHIDHKRCMVGPGSEKEDEAA